ncbi:MAG: hypothetical protein V4736_06820 [Bdellovibrionota bacterium]
MTDWAGEWYLIRKRHGESDQAFMERRSPVKNEWKREDHSFSHAEFDGIGGLITALRKCGDLTTTPRSTKKFGQPTFIELTKSIYRGIKLMDKAGVKWKLNPSPPAEAMQSCLLLDESEVEILRAKAKMSGVTMNSLMLTALQRQVSVMLENPDQKIFWLFPVNLRGPLQLENPLMNHSSGLLLLLDRSTTPAQAHEMVIGGLKTNLHWGIWFLNTIGKFTGKAFMERIYLKGRHKFQYAGTYSDLGQWEQAPGYRSLGEKDWWMAAPPGSKNFPISFVHCTFNGRMSWTMRIHPAVLDPQLPPEKILSQMYEDLFAQKRTTQFKAGEVGL